MKGSFLDPPKAAKRAVPPFFYDLMRQLVVEHDQVMNALAGDTEAVESTARGAECSVEQIMAMRDSGLSEAQIRLACEGEVEEP